MISIIVSLVGVWTFHFLILRGTEQAALINSVVTVAKIVPIIVAILVLIFTFNCGSVFDEFLRRCGHAGKTLVAQVRDTMLITVFVFLGIEAQRLLPLRQDEGRRGQGDDPRVSRRDRA